MILKKIKLHYIFLVLIILAQIVFVSINFGVNKTAYHEDEYFSYELSNSYYRPFIYGSSHQVEDSINVWETGDSFRYYIETNEDTAFSYGSVWYNQAEDVHPPLYYAVLHTICSFFPNKFSWWWGFSINIVCFAITQIYVYRLAKRLCKSEWGGVLCTAFFGFTVGAMNTFMYIRMYQMLSMFVVMYVYYSGMILLKEKIEIKKDLPPIAIICFFGSLTHHSFLILAFIYTALQCLYYIARKRFRNLLGYGLSASIGVLLSIAVFPATISHLFSNKEVWTSEPDPYTQRHLMNRLLLGETTGKVMSKYLNSVGAYLTAILVFVLLIAAAVIFIFRREIKPLEKLKKFIELLKKSDLSGYIAALASIIYVYVIAGRFFYNDVGDYADRYVFMILPLLVCAVVCLVFRLAKLIKLPKVRFSANAVICVALVSLLLYQNLSPNSEFSNMYTLKADTDNGKVNTYVDNADCIFVISKGIFLPCYPTMLMNADDVFITLSTEGYYDTQDEEYKKIYENDDEFYLLLDQSEITSLESEEAQKNAENESYDENSSTATIDDKVIEKIEENQQNQVKESDILSYYEELTGFSYEYCTKESTHFCTAKLYRFYKTDN